MFPEHGPQPVWVPVYARKVNAGRGRACSRTTKISRHSLPKRSSHHASAGRVRGAEALQTLRQACEKALYWGYSKEEQGHLPLPAPAPS